MTAHATKNETTMPTPSAAPFDPATSSWRALYASNSVAAPSDGERPARRDGVEPLRARDGTARADALDGDHQDAAGEERPRDRSEPEEVRLDGLAQEQPQDGGRKERDREREGETHGGLLAGHEAAQVLGEETAVVGDDGEDRAELDDDVE